METIHADDVPMVRAGLIRALQSTAQMIGELRRHAESPDARPAARMACESAAEYFTVWIVDALAAYKRLPPPLKPPDYVIARALEAARGTGEAEP